jgi:hypothetical protein
MFLACEGRISTDLSQIYRRRRSSSSSSTQQQPPQHVTNLLPPPPAASDECQLLNSMPLIGCVAEN